MLFNGVVVVIATLVLGMISSVICMILATPLSPHMRSAVFAASCWDDKKLLYATQPSIPKARLQVDTTKGRCDSSLSKKGRRVSQP
jgi:hypothetical protein